MSLCDRVMLPTLIRKASRTRASLITICMALVVVIGAIDYAAGNELSFSVFYLLALGLAAWSVGKGFAYFISVFSVIVSLVGDLAAPARYANHLAPFWNAFIVLAFYFVVVSLLTRLRALTKGLELRVRERTIALTEEMAERERLERELLELGERERSRIGRDLHDSLGQILTGAALAGQVLEEKLNARAQPEASDAAKVVNLIEDGISLSRTLAKGLHPIEMEPAGLMEALEDLARSSAELFKISCHFECESPVLVKDAAAAMHLYRIAQEAVTNAIKHGKAKSIVISLESLDEGTELQVRDDGCGLPDTPSRSAGMGLRIMAHRATMIGASFSSRRSEHGGTVISCKQSKADKPQRPA